MKPHLEVFTKTTFKRHDNLIVVESLNANSGHSMVAGPILDECSSLKEDFGKDLFEHCNRESNMIAHVLAEQGRVDPPTLWLDTHPSFIASLLADDVSVI